MLRADAVMQARTQERLVGSVGTTIVVTGLGCLLLFGMRVDQRFREQQPATLLSLKLAPPPPPPPRTRSEAPKANKASSRASPRNLKNKAAEIVKPPPPVLPTPPVVMTAPKVALGMAPSAGASDRPGPGQGAGGVGDGTGGGGNGDGDGDDTPPRLKKGKLKFSDLPPELRQGQIGGTVGVRYDVDTKGRVSNCVATESSGNAELDRATCRLIEEHFRYDPSRDADHRPVPSSIVENHTWVVTPEPGEADRR
ncbi:energy transducer TonB [Sphingomonas sp. MMS24-J13]|uniref:energy transducer TonB n=1 Tax=Sphingomonas sp. MMS24-J13 TaxID=3238686 RepID=UPI00384EEB65